MVHLCTEKDTKSSLQLTESRQFSDSIWKPQLVAELDKKQSNGGWN